MLRYLTLDNAAGSPVTFHETAKRYVETASGLLGISPTRDVIRARPQAHGLVDNTEFTDGSLIVLEGETFSSSIEDAIAEFRALTLPMLQTLDGNPALLKWGEGVAGLDLQKRVRLAGEVTPILFESAPAVRYQAQFRAEDPRAYSQALTTATGSTLGIGAGGLTFNRTFNWTFAASTGGTVAVNNLGNRPSPPIFRIFGGCTNPTIVLVGTGKQISLTGTIAKGDFLELDVFARTIKLNGTSNALFYLNPAATTWFELPIGTSTIQAIAFTFDATARCDVLYRSAYA